MDELLPLVLQLTNAESVSTMLSVCPFVVPLRFESHSGALKLCIDAGIGSSNNASFISRFDGIFLIVSSTTKILNFKFFCCRNSIFLNQFQIKTNEKSLSSRSERLSFWNYQRSENPLPIWLLFYGIRRGLSQPSCKKLSPFIRF